MTLNDSSSLRNRTELEVSQASLAGSPVAQAAAITGDDDSICLSDACLLMPCQSGKSPHLHTVRRWTKKGVTSVSGRRVILRTYRLGGRCYTKVSWINEFIQACTDSAEQLVACHTASLSLVDRRMLKRGLYGKGAKKRLLGL